MHGIDSSIPLFHTHVRGMRIVVTPQLVADVLHIPRVEHSNYPGCECLSTVSKDKMISAFYKRPFDWDDHQFTSCKAFTKGPRFLNMVTTFVLHPLSYYNSITGPHGRFFFLCQSTSLQIFLHISFFPLQMCIGIRLSMISSFSLWLSRRFHDIFLFLFPFLTTSPLCGPLTTLSLNGAKRSFNQGNSIQQLLPFLLLHPHPLPSLL